MCAHASPLTDTSMNLPSINMTISSYYPFQQITYFFFPPKPRASPIEPSPNPPSNLSIPSPPKIPLTRPPRPSPFSSLPTKPRTPLSNKPTAAKIWKRGSVSKPHNGLSFFFAWGMSLIFFFALSIVVTIRVVRSLRPSATRCSSGEASPDAARALA